MVDFADLVQLPTRQEIKAGIISIAQAANLTVTSWVDGDPSERWIEIAARAIDQFLSNITTQAVRAFFFDYNTDPGDAGDLSTDQTARPGWLSAFGSGWWGVQRGGADYATGFVTITNAGTSPATFKPYDLTFQRSTMGADGGKPTYRNQTDAAVYTGLGGKVTINAGASLTVPVIAEQAGSYANASPGEISVCVTQSFGTLTVTNASPVLGSDREDRSVYIARCRQQSAAASPGGPQDAYRYASTTGADGNPLQLYDGSGPTTVTRVFVSPDSSTGQVEIYLANPSGPATAAEVHSANGNINGIAIVHTDGVVYNANPIGVVPDTVVIGPTGTDSVTDAPGPAAAIATNIGPLAGTARIALPRGAASLDLVVAVQEAIAAAESLYFSTAPIGGLDQVAGAGVLYTNDLQKVASDAYAGLYAVNITKPASFTTVISIGHVPVLLGVTITAVIDSPTTPGTVRITVDQSLLGITQAQIYSTTGTLNLDGIWTLNYIDTTHAELAGSVYASGWISSKISLIVLTVVS